MADGAEGGISETGPAVWAGLTLPSRTDADRPALPHIRDGDFERVAPDLDIWDAWPVQDEHGAPHRFANGSTLWMALGAPRFDDPDIRHGVARIHLLRLTGGRWHSLGPAMPDGFSPGSREWSGSAVLERDGSTLTLYFTAAGRRGDTAPSFLQRLFRATATLTPSFDALIDWRGLAEIVPPDPRWYMPSDAGDGAIGTIKAFRDPAYYRDPVGGGRYLTFAGSLANSDSAFNGVVGLVEGNANGEWRLRPPIVSADGVNNELERPHIVHHDGRHYLFWSTQAHVFAPDRPGPTGLYGMVADTMPGPWRPLNGDGLIFANPSNAPAQSYSWLVLPDLTVISFVDDWSPVPGGKRRFGASFAPRIGLGISGDAVFLR